MVRFDKSFFCNIFQRCEIIGVRQQDCDVGTSTSCPYGRKSTETNLPEMFVTDVDALVLALVFKDVHPRPNWPIVIGHKIMAEEFQRKSEALIC